MRTAEYFTDDPFAMRALKRTTSENEEPQSGVDSSDMSTTIEQWRDLIQSASKKFVPPYERGGKTVHDLMLITGKQETATRNLMRMLWKAGKVRRETYKRVVYYFLPEEKTDA